MRALLWSVAVLALLPAVLQGAVVYQTAGDMSTSDPIQLESYTAYGDQITLGGTARRITSISIPFVLENDPSDPSTTATPYTPDLTLSLYINDGTLTSTGDSLTNTLDVVGNQARPGTVISSSHLIGPTFQPLAPENDLRTLTFNFPDAPLVPSTFSFAVAQNNQDPNSNGANQFAIVLSDIGGATGGPKFPQLIGTSSPFVWVKDATTGLFEATDYGYDPKYSPFLAIEATVTAVPEPTTLWLLGAGGAACLIAVARQRARSPRIR